MNFQEWLPQYLDFRSRAYKVLDRELPTDLGGLQVEMSRLEPLRSEAERMRATALGYYYHAKLVNIEKLRAEGWAMSAVSEVAKAASHKELWVKEDAEGIARSSESRSIKVSMLHRGQA